VATNFIAPAREIAAAFAAESDVRVLLSFGSTGQLYAQIAQGAPFDVYLAADAERPARALADGLAVAGNGFTYAYGRLALFSEIYDVAEGPAALRRDDFLRIAIANPRTAPYGAAAVDVLARLDLYDALKAKIVQGTSIAQTFQFVASGNAELGFIAYSQLTGRAEGSRWLVPETMHEPLAQDAVLLTHARDPAAGKAFLAFLRSDPARAIIQRYGYDLPRRP